MLFLGLTNYVSKAEGEALVVSGPMANRRLKLAVVLLFLSIYLLTMKGISMGDNAVYYEVAKNIVRDGSPTMSYEVRGAFFTAEGKDGRIYSTLGIGQSIAVIPLFAIGELLERWVPPNTILETGDIEGLRKSPTAVCTALLNPIATALTCLLVFLFCLEFANSYRLALLLAMAYGFATIAWVYSSTFWTQPLVTLLLMSAFYCVYRYGSSPRIWYLIVAGACLGFSSLTRVVSVMAVPFFLLYLFLSTARKHRSSRRTLAGSVLFFLLPLLFFAGVHVFWNYYRFGHLFQTGYFSVKGRPIPLKILFQTPLRVGLAGFLFSLGNSIFLFSPVLILVFLGMKSLWRYHRSEAALIVCLASAYLLFYSKWWDWPATGSWGPRYLVPIVPLLILPLSVFLRARKPVWLKACPLLFLSLSGVFVQTVGVMPPVLNPTTQETLYAAPVRFRLEYFSRSQLLTNLHELSRGNVDLWFFKGGLWLIPATILFVSFLAAAYYTVKVCGRLDREVFEVVG